MSRLLEGSDETGVHGVAVERSMYRCELFAPTKSAREYIILFTSWLFRSIGTQETIVVAALQGNTIWEAISESVATALIGMTVMKAN